MELLGDEVNQSGLIEYIELPRLYDADKPVEADLPDFVDRLAADLKLQVGRVQDGVTAPDRIHAQIQSHSWDSLIDHVNELILELTK